MPLIEAPCEQWARSFEVGTVVTQRLGAGGMVALIATARRWRMIWGCLTGQSFGVDESRATVLVDSFHQRATIARRSNHPVLRERHTAESLTGKAVK
jgi:hypothetical protein